APGMACQGGEYPSPYPPCGFGPARVTLIRAPCVGLAHAPWALFCWGNAPSWQGFCMRGAASGAGRLAAWALPLHPDGFNSVCCEVTLSLVASAACHDTHERPMRRGVLGAIKPLVGLALVRAQALLEQIGAHPFAPDAAKAPLLLIDGEHLLCQLVA